MSDVYCPPKESNGGWRIVRNSSDIRGMGLDVEALEEFAEWNMGIHSIPTGAPSHASFVVIKDGWLVYENYDRPETRFIPSWTASIGKGMSACILGMWLHTGVSRFAGKLSLESRVYDPQYLPEGFPLSDSRKENINFCHLLTHTSGMKPSPEAFHGKDFSFVDYTVGHSKHYPDSQELVFDPGKGYGYSNVAYNHLAIMAPHLTGLLFHECIERELFVPIGIEKASWFSGGPGYLSAGKLYQPSCAGPDITARDLARFAYLLLKDGAWENRIIIPSWFINEMKQVHRMNEDQPNDYGLGIHTNVNGSLSNDLPKDAFALRGAGLNIILIIPSMDLIVIRTSTMKKYNSKAFFYEFVEKAKHLWS